ARAGLRARKRVGNDIPALGRPHPARAPEAALDLIEDEQDAVLVAQRSKAREEAVWWDHDPAAALDGRDQDRRERPDAGARILQRRPHEPERAFAGGARSGERGRATIGRRGGA